MLNESDFIAALARGEAAAAEKFAADYLPRVRWIVRSFGVRDSDVEDVIQEIFLETLRQTRAGRFRGGSQFFSWLYHISKGKAIDYARRPVNRHDRTAVNIGSMSAPDERRLAISADQEALASAEQALTGMPVRLQLVLRLHYRDGHTALELARRMHLSEKRVRALLTEAKKQFRAGVLGHEKTASVKRLTDQHGQSRRVRTVLKPAT